MTPAFRLARIAAKNGPVMAAVAQDKFYELPRTWESRDATNPLTLLADWDRALSWIEQNIRDRDAVPLADMCLLSPIPAPGAVICAGANYADHAAEMAKVQGREPPPDPHTLGLPSWHFIKNSHAIADPGSQISIPQGVTHLDWEAELVVVIGKPAKGVSRSAALNHVAGYTIANDLSARDLGTRNVPPVSPFRFDWTSHKSFDGSCPLGPWIVPSRDIPDPHDLGISLSVNGETKQSSNTSEMIYRIEEQIEQISARMTLWPGDLILTGTPAGVGHAGSEYLKSGDRVAVRVERIGELLHSIA